MALYAKTLPETIDGGKFLEEYKDHNDPVTIIDEKRTYVVRAPTLHPINENFRVKVRTLFQNLIGYKQLIVCSNRCIFLPNSSAMIWYADLQSTSDIGKFAWST